jgi:O-antigen/teichoic acid export membrane protein
MSADGAEDDRRIGRNLGWKLAGTIVDKSMRLGLVVAATRAMGETTWGRLAYAMAATALFAQLADLGTSLYLARETAKRGSVDETLLGNLTSLRLRLAALYAVTVFVLAAAHHDEPAIAVAIALTGANWLLQSTLEFGWHVFRGLERLELEARQQVAQSVLQVVLGGSVVAWIAWGRDVPGDSAMIAFAGAILVSQALIVGFTARRLWTFSAKANAVDAEMVQRFRREILPLGVAIVASLIYYKIDVPMLRLLRGDAETGQYAAAYRLFEMLAILPAIALSAIFPAVTRQLASDPKRAAALHLRARRILGVVGLSVGMVFFVGADEIVALLYGPQFAPSAAVLRALAPAVALTFINYLETHMLVALGQVRWQMVVAVVLIFVNVAINAWWIPIYGAAGAALATAITELALLAAVAPRVAQRLALLQVEP